MDAVPKVGVIYKKTLETLKELGAEIVEFDEFATIEKLDESEFTVLLFDYKQDLNNYLVGASEKAKSHSIEDVIKFNDEHKDKVLQYFGQESLIACLEKGDFDDDEYVEAKKVYEEYKTKLLSFMDEHKLDALISPSNGPSWLIDTVNGDLFTGLEGTTSIAAINGFPNITVPMGYVSELPIGLNFVGRNFAEPDLIKFAYSFEQATKVRKQSQFLPTIE